MSGPRSPISSAAYALPDGYPRRLGRYTLVAPLGEGGMATVHVARRDGDPRICVLKQLHGKLAEHEETNRRFHREAHIAATLDHPGIARIVDAGFEDGVFCIALELIAGQTVEAMVKSARRRGGTLPFEITVRVIVSALDALSHAHELTDPEGRALGLVHRDLSPRNLMVGYDGQTKVIDFGIAKGRVDDHRTAVGVLMGTPYYMSPEQARAVEIDHRSDLYTMGAVLFEMLTGHRLVSTKGRAKILMSVVRDPAPSLLERNPHAPPELAPVVAKALSKEPEGRFQTARAMSDALRSAFDAARARTASFEPHARLHGVSVDQIGQFLRELMPEGEASARALLETVKRVAPVTELAESTRIAELDGPAVVPTRLAPADFVVPTRAAGPGDIYDPSEPPPEPTMLGLPEAAFAEPMLVEPTVAQPDFPGFPPRPPQPARRVGLWTAVASFIAMVGFAGWAWFGRTPLIVPEAISSPTEAEAMPSAVTVAEVTSPRAAPTVARPSASEPAPSPVPRPSPVRPPPSTRPSPRTPKAPEPKETPEPKAPQPLSPHARRLAALRRAPSRREAIAFADDLRTRAEALPSGPLRSRVLSESERVLRTADIDDMLEALAQAVRLLEKAGG